MSHDQIMPKNSNTLSLQLAVLLPTLAVSALLTHFGMALIPRMAASLGFGAALIAVLAYLRR